MGVSLSVVIPVRNDAERLRACLAAIRESTVAPHEIIVADDASDDRPERVAGEPGVVVTRLAQPSGPGTARNAGAVVASGDVIVFIDADVCVHRDTLQRMRDDFDANADLDAVFGSYEVHAGADNYISWYKNLQHHYVHQTSRPDAWTFWSGCGAVRRDVFLAHGGFHTALPGVEDIELGMRIFRAGGVLKLDRDVQAMHMKRWSLRTLIRAEVLVRAAPWTQLLLHYHGMPDDLNLRLTQRLCVVLSVIALLAGIAGCVGLGASFAGPFGAVLLLLLTSYLADALGIGRAGVTRWRKERHAALYIGALAALLLALAPWHWLSLTVIACVTTIVWLNLDFYRFLSVRWGYLNTMSAVPFHLIYYLCSALGLSLGVMRYVFSPRCLVSTQSIAHKRQTT